MLIQIRAWAWADDEDGVAVDDEGLMVCCRRAGFFFPFVSETDSETCCNRRRVVGRSVGRSTNGRQGRACVIPFEKKRRRQKRKRNALRTIASLTGYARGKAGKKRKVCSGVDFGGSDVGRSRRPPIELRDGRQRLESKRMTGWRTGLGTLRTDLDE